MKKITQEELNEVIRLHGLWLKNDPKGVRLDLRCCELIGLAVTGVSFDRSTFIGCTFGVCTFIGCTFFGSTFDDIKFFGCTFEDSRFDGCTFIGIRFFGCTFIGSTFFGSTFFGIRFDGCTFDRIRFDGCTFDGSRFIGCTFDGANGEQLVTSAAMGWSGLYIYYVFALISDKGPWIRMGCHWRSLADWEADFWNNPDEFPNDGSAKSNMRLAAYNFAKEWIKNNS